ncbi:hypothetical protein GCK32_017055 [Trichostrongylus colubriformis]|uniref:Rad4/PNGase transglutaminase-like fold domain-containing protein n=1 Tax=Trichostrongylus colubriformis TaxID=6319 RepID=A0AAN8FNY5_TRICO
MGCTARICVSIQPIPRKWDESVLKWIAKMRDGSSSSSVTSQTNKKGKGTSKKNSTSGSDRNYWIEYWDKKQKRWICVDPFRATVDEPSTVVENVTKPMVYVLAIDAGKLMLILLRNLFNDRRWRPRHYSSICSRLLASRISPASNQSGLDCTYLEKEIDSIQQKEGQARGCRRSKGSRQETVANYLVRVQKSSTVGRT